MNKFNPRKLKNYALDVQVYFGLKTLYKQGLISKPILRKAVYDTSYSKRDIFLEFYVNIEQLVFDVKNVGEVSIDQTPHFKAALWIASNGLRGSIEDYKKYLASCFPSASVKDHVYTYQSLFSRLTTDSSNEVILVRREVPPEKRFHVLDGTHRSAILYVLGQSKIKVAMESAFQSN